MLNPFPDVLLYSALAPFILRLVSAFIFIDLGILAFKNEKERWIISFKTLKIPNETLAVKIFGTLEIIFGLAILVGLYTQVAALVLALLTLCELYIEYKDPMILKRNFIFYIMLFAMVLSLLFSGAGAFAFDLPL